MNKINKLKNTIHLQDIFVFFLWNYLNDWITYFFGLGSISSSALGTVFSMGEKIYPHAL